MSTIIIKAEKHILKTLIKLLLQLYIKKEQSLEFLFDYRVSLEIGFLQIQGRAK